MSGERYSAVGLLTRRDLDVLGSGFRRAYPPQDTSIFNDLLIRLDQMVRAAQPWRGR